MQKALCFKIPVTISISNKPDDTNDEVISSGLERHNRLFSSGSFEPLSVYSRTEDGTIVGGLIGVSYGGWLHISELWVHEEHREKSIGSKILVAAETEAIGRQCIGVTLDTYSFQALDFYLNRGYEQFGWLDGYAGIYKRHYLQKKL